MKMLVNLRNNKDIKMNLEMKLNMQMMMKLNMKMKMRLNTKMNVTKMMDVKIKCERDIVDLLVSPATKSKPRGRRGSWSPHGFPSFLCGGRPAGDAMVPMCDQGFGPPAGGRTAPAGVESGKGKTVKGGERRRV
jgi:hypothetical protein